eukprot:CAMPEP_0180417292 /NCGR_PEP_ID=MMETSP1036_2-20121128/952_1 /TAXON_ID=632150 /ORGANISM="Azadinium spinosum, Strain 3D9" /LENGTH=141 /DNA_ID=CAMNT_0022422305 /DNA_START=197 /DNA_END=619 /DNA_ORIENTATION=+
MSLAINDAGSGLVFVLGEKWQNKPICQLSASAVLQQVVHKPQDCLMTEAIAVHNVEVRVSPCEVIHACPLNLDVPELCGMALPPVTMEGIDSQELGTCKLKDWLQDLFLQLLRCEVLARLRGQSRHFSQVPIEHRVHGCKA